MTPSWPEIAQEALKVPGLLVEIYGDLAKPGVRQAGKALESIIGLGNTILWPIAWANERSRIYLERNLELYRQRLSEIPEEKIVAVAPEIGVPIAEKLSYVADARLSELYVTLLAKASASDTVSVAHPSFVNVINNLSPDEAQLLEYFSKSSDGLPFVTANRVDTKTGEYGVSGDLLVTDGIRKDLHFPDNVPAYLSNFEGLGLIQVFRDRRIADTPAYDELISHWTPLFPVDVEAEAQTPPRELKFDKGAITLSLFGKLFISACRD